MKLISVVTGCFNEEDNIEELHSRIRAQFERLPAYDYEHIFIDNASTDATVARIKAIAVNDRRVRLIVNARNFGHIRSPMHALLQARGDAVIA
ncbi:MAG TPA: glycosyltransferase, partial [Candidatus Accumulibacter sp.]|nr:glycosyltransferase [Accumulibacter sp.]